MTTVIGASGAAIILIAFISIQFHFLKPSDFRYHLLNLLGSIILLAYDVLLESVPFFVLNAIWGTAALFEVAKMIRMNYSYKRNLPDRKN